MQIGARPHAEVRISQKNTVSWTNSGFEKVCQNFPESPSDVVGGVVQEGSVIGYFQVLQIDSKQVSYSILFLMYQIE